MHVFKFGGAALRDADGIRNVARIIRDHGTPPLVIVVSAIGKTTNALEAVVRAYVDGDAAGALTQLEAVRQQHYALLSELVGNDEAAFGSLNDLFVEIEWILEEEPDDPFDYLYDQIVSVGELLSSRIVEAYLRHKKVDLAWLDARDVILTDEIYREGWVQWAETKARTDRLVRPLLEAHERVLTQGFIGSTSDNNTTTLGREGSDYTAAIFSHCLDAVAMTIWKDVPGVLTADPRRYDNVTKLDAMSYKEAIEMTYYGAKVIHPKTIKPLQNKRIPLYVKSFVDPTGSGTFVSDEVDDHYPPLVAVEDEQALLQIATRDFSFVAEHHMVEIFQQVAATRLQINLMQNTAISFNICVNDIDDRIERFVALLERDFRVRVERDLELITVRHQQRSLLDVLKRDKVVRLENRLGQTVQLVLKTAPVLQPRS